MDEIYKEFTTTISNIRQTSDVYKYLKDVVKIETLSFDDILRSQIVTLVIALDRYFHEKVRKGICDMFLGNKSPTSKFKSFSLTSETVLRVWGDNSLTPVQREMMINEAVALRLKAVSFQHASKIKDALSFIWEAKHKMTLIAKEMDVPGANDNDKEKYLTQKLDLLVGRRNQIAHESDMGSSGKRSITQMEVVDAITFIESFVACVDRYV